MLPHQEKKNALWNSSSFVLISLLGFVNFTINFNSFPNDILGLFILINSIFGIGFTLDFGFGVSTVKHIAEANKKSDSDSVNTIFVTFFFAFLAITLIIVLLFTAYYYLIFKNTDIFLNTDNTLIFGIYFILTGGFVFRYMSNYLGRVFEGFSRFVLLSKINVSFAFLNTIFVLAIFLYKLNIIYLALFLSLNNLLLFISLFVLALKKLKILKFKLSFLNLKLLKKYALYSLNIQAAFFVGGFIDPIIKFLIGGSFGLNFVTLYESAKKIIDLTNGLIFSAQKEVLVKLSEANSINTLKEFVNNRLYIYSKIANYYSIFIYGILNPFICVFILLWFKSFESMIIFLIFLPAYSLINFGGCLYNALMVEGRGIKLLLIQSINVILISLILFFSLEMSKSFLGLFGFYISIVINTILLLIFIKSEYTLNYKKYLGDTSFIKLIFLNIGLIAQIFAIYFLKTYLYYILFISLILYIIMFYKLILYFFNKIKEKIILFGVNKFLKRS